MKDKLKFRVHTAQLLNEIFDNAVDQRMGILKIPINVFRGLLLEVGDRASQINDPILNALMCDLAIYAIADPTDPNYDKQALAEVYKKADAARAKLKNENRAA